MVIPKTTGRTFAVILTMVLLSAFCGASYCQEAEQLKVFRSTQTFDTADSPKATTIAVVSMDNGLPIPEGFQGGRVQFNTVRVCAQCDQAADAGANLVVFPEEALTSPFDETCYFQNGLGIPDINRWPQYADLPLLEDSPATVAILAKAKERNIYVAWSMLTPDPNDRRFIHNTEVLVGPEGIVGTYNKVHLPFGEQIAVSSGGDFPVFDTKIGKIGLMICYDNVFPESFRVMALKGANIIVDSTGWPTSAAVRGQETSTEDDDYGWYGLDTLCRAAAISNGVFIALSNAAGYGGVGHSTIYSPMGLPLAQTEGADEGIAIANIGDPAREATFTRVQTMFGANGLKDRHPEAYGEILKLKPGCYMGDSPLRNKINEELGR